MTTSLCMLLRRNCSFNVLIFIFDITYQSNCSWCSDWTHFVLLIKAWSAYILGILCLSLCLLFSTFHLTQFTHINSSFWNERWSISSENQLMHCPTMFIFRFEYCWWLSLISNLHSIDHQISVENILEKNRVIVFLFCREKQSHMRNSWETSRKSDSLIRMQAHASMRGSKC